MHTPLQDLRYGLSLLRQRPNFTAMAALSLALGIGASTVLFQLCPCGWHSLAVRLPAALGATRLISGLLEGGSDGYPNSTQLSARKEHLIADR